MSAPNSQAGVLAMGAIALMLTAMTVGAQSARPRIVIVATGGTIAGAAESTTAAGYKSGAVAVDVLIAAVPQMKKFADVRGVQVSSVGSQDMNAELWVKLATEVNRLLAQSDVDGVAITHGTDTMEETAYFLNLVVKSDKPVVLTGSMRPSTSLSADGPLNIYNAVGVASDERAKGRGVLVVANDDIHGARAITKRHTTDVETFVSPEVGLIGVCLFDDREFSRTPIRAHTTSATPPGSTPDRRPFRPRLASPPTRSIGWDTAPPRRRPIPTPFRSATPSPTSSARSARRSCWRSSAQG
jgi:L-asparaginase